MSRSPFIPSDSADLRLKVIRMEVDRQAEDEGLWFEAQTAAEGYLQQELRRLHALIEDATK